MLRCLKSSIRVVFDSCPSIPSTSNVQASSEMTLRLSIDETDLSLKTSVDRYSDWKAFLVLRRCLEPDGDLSVDQATALIHEMLPAKTDKDCSVVPTLFCYLCVDVADKIPYSHPVQHKFVDLIKNLKVSDRINQNLYCELGGGKVSKSVLSLYISIREHYPYDFEPGTAEEQQYLNISAFIARLAAAGVARSMGWAVWKMADNLEDEPSDDTYSACVSDAAVWILCAGQWLFIQIFQASEEDEDAPQLWRTGSRYNGPIFGMERWNFWQTAFAAAAESKVANAECRMLATKAKDFMPAIAQAITW
ncbi:hypothetical protein BO78DRAFT_439585 [Aspergillus sclerotiicarbonarius CBS 121057]|uniref:Uncharacterized protein n=1 Tax=Aspergillus sclerotiicarbonarius (strain CBS 121057 / IBT 28362) TaxID=1448318 RepID=A0A319DVG8_ASPSB|nr:hypothetical protein BO78DRAFT_439585 [Aspergillus sclerotiicarbonarius CBS 121057]